MVDFKQEIAVIFARNLKRVREALGVSQSKAARDLDMSASSWNQYESEKTDMLPELHRAVMMAKYLGTGLDELVGLSPRKSGQEPGMRKEMREMVHFLEHILKHKDGRRHFEAIKTTLEFAVRQGKPKEEVMPLIGNAMDGEENCD